jgi:hypothetical protein
VLRRPVLIGLGLPIAIGLCAFLVLYHLLVATNSWLSLSTLLLVGLVIGMATAANLFLSRFAKRFDPEDRSTNVEG